ncbi:MAG: aminodeoxychorismate synthase component I [Lachnospiraceae bacterium]|nr:aminodeoxychorismate synthase component I [Lachnospiraceae bacterium]
MRLIQEYGQYPEIERIFAQVQGEKDAVFLDSSLHGSLGRYSIIALHPYMKLVKGEQFTVNGEVSKEKFEVFVKRYLKEHREENPTGLPLVSGAVGYFSYDYGRVKEGVASRHGKEADIPDCVLIFYDSFMIEEHEKQKLFLIANGHGQDCRKGMAKLQALVDLAEKREGAVIYDGLPAPPKNGGKSEGQFLKGNHRPKACECKVTANFTKEDYKQAVRKMIQYIIEGDIYIANMTQRLRIESDMSPYELFRRLRKVNPSPFGGYFNYGDFQIISASPERFLQMRDRHIQTRPIKGTRKRGRIPEEDRALRRELELSEKDKSELLMIVDLERNDLNRICVPGSVKVTELFTVEAYATVFHLVSNVGGELREELTAMDLLEAAFPGGSITGAPKLRAMELVDELEHGRRDLYTGSMGYLSLDGDCDLNIVIRTALYRDGIYHLGVGGGITCESDPEFEYEETIQKARAFLNIFEEE